MKKKFIVEHKSLADRPVRFLKREDGRVHRKDGGDTFLKNSMKKPFKK